MRNDFVPIEDLMLKEVYFIIMKLDCEVRHIQAVPNRTGKE